MQFTYLESSDGICLKFYFFSLACKLCAILMAIIQILLCTCTIIQVFHKDNVVGLFLSLQGIYLVFPDLELWQQKRCCSPDNFSALTWIAEDFPLVVYVILTVTCVLNYNSLANKNTDVEFGVLLWLLSIIESKIWYYFLKLDYKHHGP